MKNFFLLARFLQVVLVRVAQAAAKREGRQLVVGVCRWMGYLKRAVDLAAVTELDFVFGLGHVLVVAALTEIMRPVAEVDGHAAAEQALPLDVLRPVLVAHGVSDTIGFKLAVLAHEVLSRGLLLDIHVSSAIDHSSEVGL